MSQHQNTPQFIKQVPWYANKQGKTTTAAPPTAGASNSTKSKLQSQQWYDRGSKGYQATTFRKGACENCGAMGHNRKQCTERPRKVAAKYTMKNIAPDDVTKQIELNWEGKRDRWNGYDVNMYKQVVEQYQQYEEIRKMSRQQRGEEDVDKQFKHSVDPIQLASLPTKNAKNQKFQGLGGVRNREDYAKYLINLDVNSQTFDPKSRSLRSYDNPAAQLDNLDVYGQRDQFINQDRFAAQQVQLHNSELSTVALPTLTQKIYKKIKQNNQGASALNKSKQITKKYGESIGQKPIQVIVEEDQFIDYKKQQKPGVKSRYQEDVLINDHLSVWGSWYNRLLGWGYACCHSTDKYSYCLGNKGKQKALAAELKVKAQRLRDLQQLQQAAKNVQQNNENVEENSSKKQQKQQ